MGLNLVSACHRCKEKVFHFRNKENETMIPFYRKHIKCMKLNPSNVETLDDQHQWRDWMCGKTGYKESNE